MNAIRSHRMDAHALTGPERAVLTASATGRSATDIAELLGQTPEGVWQLLAAAMDKLGARSKLEAIVIAVKDRSIEIDPS